MKAQAIAPVLQGVEVSHVFFAFPIFRIFVPVINGLTIGSGNNCSVVFGFIAPFDFEGIHSDAQQIGQPGHQAHIFGVQHIAAVLVFHHFKIFAGTEFFLKQKFKGVFVLLVNFDFFQRAVF